MNEHNEVANIVADAMEVFIKNNFHKPMTNYDRIKSMSVEEMAVNLAKIQCDAIAQTVPITVTEEARK